MTDLSSERLVPIDGSLRETSRRANGRQRAGLAVRAQRRVTSPVSKSARNSAMACWSTAGKGIRSLSDSMSPQPPKTLTTKATISAAAHGELLRLTASRPQRSAAGQMMRKSQKEQISCVGVGWKSWREMPAPISSIVARTRSSSSSEWATGTFSAVIT